MMPSYSKANILRGASVAAAALQTIFLVALLPQPGYQTSRLVLFAVVIGLGWVGAAGAVRNRFALTVGSALGLFLLGFWQFTIGLVMLPTAAIFLVTALLTRGESETQSKPAAVC
ncbi:hypothetical protein E6P09_01825 [Haloferax mediterranei ATCC 33500]|uniref:Uncharacterized protein n=1 Tax=Haloferax mediterranei (strain ATCC 33500 / DSM 1411 / JCM 8866 / NBRC 14739 / NCIMB 2177 / R-4) TaxID=523841 RepID=I3R606_HALMT|nr:hypothetical protein [Haloferax mediterranei]AFK19666.1 hypothetical protein HFX_1973 [Haloferax mediterranei ATCC 33500]AHZ23055.1 hypothetical protein BM92_10595 [Haloferax mediterranei ATCC 33500]ELZ99986.1 hypothetical protein C439_11643 [Haloferax mediterranei ATCC 33500]MDX5987592.1 hypothetical protein [Haloferax mediterranei ATCC 33500]QCQ74080.1 hypothetical protein E6P09_01825 [Haloferax mediterranei ATCC 33500]